MENILNLKNVKVNNELIKKIIVNVMIVQKCNFNDTFYIADKEILVSDIKDNPISYFDPFLGKVNNSNIKVAIASIDEDEYYVIIDENGTKKVEVNENYLDVILTAEKDERTFLSSHIRLSTEV